MVSGKRLELQEGTETSTVCENVSEIPTFLAFSRRIAETETERGRERGW